MAHLMPLPEPSLQIQDLLAELRRADRRETDQRTPTEELPKPWDISSIADPDLRAGVWHWLEAFVIWFNTQQTWFSQEQIPACWPEHAPLVHQLGILGFQRYEASAASSPDALERWHHVTLPEFLGRSRDQRLGCHETHKPWPGRAEMNRHLLPAAAERRQQAFMRDYQSDEDETTMTLRILSPITTGSGGAQQPPSHQRHAVTHSPQPQPH